MFCFPKKILTPEQIKVKAVANAEQKRLAMLAKEEKTRQIITKLVEKDILPKYKKGWYSYHVRDYHLNYYSQSWLFSEFQKRLQHHGIVCSLWTNHCRGRDDILPNASLIFEKQSMQRVLKAEPLNEVVQSEATLARYHTLQSKASFWQKQKRKTDQKVYARILSKLDKIEKQYIHGSYQFSIRLEAPTFYDEDAISDMWVSQVNKHRVLKYMTISCTVQEHSGDYWIEMNIVP